MEMILLLKLIMTLQHKGFPYSDNDIFIVKLDNSNTINHIFIILLGKLWK